MSVPRLVLVSLLAVASLVVAGPARAQDGASTTTSSTTTIPLEGGDGGEGPGGSPTTDDPEIPPLDPLATAQARTEGQQAAFAIRTRIKEIGTARLDVARDGSASAQQRLDELTGRYLGEAGQVQRRADELDETQLAYQRLVEIFLAARNELQRRVTLLYAQGPGAGLEEAVRSGDLLDSVRRTLLAQAVIEEGRDDVVDAYLDASEEAPGGFDLERTEIAEAREYLSDLTTAREILRDELDAANAELAAVRAAVVPDIVFPIEGREYDFIDSFLFCRDGCRRRHQGVDIMAPHGTPLLAVEQGVLFRLGTGRLGGIKLWLLGESGAAYYYAHLSGYSELATEGAFVRAGDVIGFVGNTGNAISTPPHLHLEVHPTATGRAVNPYPLMRQAADLREIGPDPLDGLDAVPVEE
ncbi:MAG: M23 family metallopeptidase [Actinomycetota bacterium]